ncbi:hypothetical protein EV426DRAFT_539226 [Tirmania nivea]|nr:hypothetical protein EV426DRAFT_539226 [Tirmania nivea]
MSRSRSVGGGRGRSTRTTGFLDSNYGRPQGFQYPRDVLVSAPVDFSTPMARLNRNVAGQLIVVTGGASGIGEACCRRLALLGAHVAVCDLNKEKGEEIATAIQRSVRDIEGRGSARFFRCDVSNWESQSQMFVDILDWSPAGRGVINCVIANAGISEADLKSLDPHQPPPPPNLATFNVNYVGALYTIRLAQYFLRKSPSGDRHLLIMGSFAGFLHSPLACLYSSSKHGLIGLFASLRLTSLPQHKVRINMLNPYFVRTPIMPTAVSMLMVGHQLVDMDQCTNLVVRFCGDNKIMGRMVAIGPNMEEDVEIGGGLEEIEVFSRRAVKALNVAYRTSWWFNRYGRIVRDLIVLVLGLVWVNWVLGFRDWVFGRGKGRR